ncbi:MAG: DHA2 family efflux MFS transporter permease subunit [Coriobacteriia bacterium]|nr:DHA2 family efflux MFS transporter permease subunit [Coriobacteriia bacterium]
MAKLGISRENWHLVIIVFCSTFVAFFNQTTVNPALPSIMHDFSVNAPTAQWLFSGYTLALAIVIPVNAHLLEKYSVKRIIICALCIYSVGCFLTGLGDNFALVLIGRLIQGCGNGLLMPTTMAVCFYVFPKERRGIALGVYGLLIGFAPILGPAVSGFVVDNFTWHWIYIGVGFCVIICLIAAIVLLSHKHIAEENTKKFDYVSLVTSLLGFGSLLFGFSEIGKNGFSVISVIPICIGIVIVAYFIYRQLHIDNPMLRITILKNKKYSVAIVVFMIVQASVIGAIVLFPLLIQNVLGYSATESGLAMIPSAIVMGIMGPITGNILDKRGIRGMAISGLVILVISSLLLSCLSLQSTLFILIVYLCIRNLGSSFVIMNINTWGINALDSKDIPHASAISNTARMVAVSFGTAISTSTYSMISYVLSDNADIATAGVYGIDSAFALQGLFCVIALVLTVIFVKDKK